MAQVLAKLTLQTENQKQRLRNLRAAPLPSLRGLKVKRPAVCMSCHQPKATSHRVMNPITGKEVHACSPRDLCRDYKQCQYERGHPEIKVEARIAKLEAKTLAVQEALRVQVRALIASVF